MKLFKKIRKNTQNIKKDIRAIYFASKRSDIGLAPKLIIVLVIAYALSPIDLIPDFIPLFGYLDDLIILPLGISLAIKLIPKEILDECRKKAKEESNLKIKKNYFFGFLIIILWILLVLWIIKIIN